MTSPGKKSSEPLLKTKLFVPHLPQVLVKRVRLIERINAGTGGPLTLVSAPAGFGKTTAVAAWAEQSRMPVAWLSLDEDDNTPQRFFSYLIAALDQVAGEALSGTLSVLQSPQPFQLPMLVMSLLSELEAIPQPFVLVLDDYHTLHAQALHEALAQLLDHLPPQMHLVLATRADPPVQLARMRARGALVELRADDLRFSYAESAEFLNRVMGLDLDTQDVATLENRTEGWIAGLQMAALSMQGRQDISGFIQAFSGSHRFILDFLMEEVMARQPEHVKQFLLRTSILEQLHGSLCDALFGYDGQENSRQVLEQLDHANLFLVPLDDERRWYRYHHLFAELLQAQLYQDQAELVPDLHRRAAQWYAQNGFPAKAVQHGFAAQDYVLAAELLERHGHERWSFSDMTFLSLIGKLPAELLQSRPKLGVYQVWTLIISGRLPAAEELLASLVHNFSEDYTDPEIRGLRSFIALLQAYIPVVMGRETESALPDRQALAYVPEHHLGMRNSADVVYAYLLYMRGDFNSSAELLLAAVQRDVAAQGTTAIPIAISRLARMRMIEGRLREAAGLCREYMQPVQARGAWQFYIPGYLDIVLGDVLREWNDLAAAERHIREGLQANEAWNAPQAYAIGYTALARLQHAQGDIAGALQTLTSLETLTQGKVITPDVLSEIQSLEVGLWLASGNLEAAAGWEALLKPVNQPDFKHELEQITRGRVWIAQGRNTEALSFLERLAHCAEAGKRLGRLLEIRLLQALALTALERLVEGLETFEGCLSIGEAEGYMRTFLDEGEPLRGLLSAYLRNSSTTHESYARKLLDAFGSRHPDPSPPVSQSSLVEPLTPRELQVLRLICEGDSNQAIAEKLVVTINAVKKHAGNIYGKLGVSSRTQAIAQARKLGLFKS